MSSFSVRYFLVDADDDIVRLPQARFERLASRASRETLPELKGQRVRAAEVAVELRSGRPVRVVRMIFYYIHFDQNGRLDYERFMKDGVTVMEAGLPRFKLESADRSVIEAQQRFAKRRRDHSVWWKPDSRLESVIVRAALDRRNFRRL